MNRYEPLFAGPIGRDIARHADEPAVVFIFPSQEGADSWARALVKSGMCRAVALDRFFGFENFLRFCAQRSLRGAEREARPLDRWIWALEALDSIGHDDSSVSRLISPAESSAAHLSRLAGLIPSFHEEGNLAAAAAAALANPYAFIKEESEELTRLAAHYRKFLREHGIVDGHFGPFGIPDGLAPRAYGLQDDFARLGFGGIEFPDIGDTSFEESADQEYFEFDSFLSELEWAFSAISNEIGRGCDPEDIALSVCRLNARKAAWIRQAAGDAGVAVSIRWGEPLTGTPFGRLLGAVRSAASEGLTLNSIDSFAAFSSIRERDPEGWKRIRDDAMRAHIPNTSPQTSYIHQLWRESTRTGFPAESSAQFYSRLWQDISDIVGADSFAGLYEALLGFIERWVDTTKFGQDARTDRSMRMALDELQAWAGSEHRVKRGDFSPFELFMISLGSKAYIPLLEDGAVRVYDFMASPGMAVMSHYIVGASQSGMAAVGPATALPGALASLIATREEDDSARVLAMRRISRTTFSYAREGFEGYEVAFPQLGAPSARPGSPKRASPTGTTGRAASARAASGGAADSISRETAAHFLKITGSYDFERNLAVFSPHSLKDRAQCGFRWFAQRLGLEDAYAGDDEARILGDFLHDAYRRAIVSSSGGAADFGAALDEALRVSATKILKERGPGLRPALLALVDKARHRLTTLREFELAAFAEYPSRAFEQKIAQVFDAEGAILNGRIDCVFSREDASAGMPCRTIVDYKKNRIPALSEMKPRAQQGALTDQSPYSEGEAEDSEDSGLALSEIQIPSYALMLEMQGSIVEGALYWSIEKAQAAGYIAPPATAALPKSARSAYASESETGPARAALRNMLASAASNVARGRLLDRAADRENCDDCAFAPLCRYWYFLEL